MAFVLFVIYIPNEPKPHEVEEIAKEETVDLGIDQENGTESKEGVEVGVADPKPSPISESSFKTADESVKTPDDVSSLETDAVPVTPEIKPVTEPETREITADGQESNESTQSEHEVDFLCEAKPFSELLKEELQSLQVHNDVWKTSDDEKHIQVSFVERSGSRCEEILTRISSIGIGRTPDTTMSVLPTSVHLQYESDSDSDDTMEHEGNEIPAEEKAHEFMKSVKSRLVVEQVVSSVKTNAELTFDYVMLIILASWIAAIGLGENSSVVLVASMLISPLMGPILAAIFGTVVQNSELRNLGIKSELIGLAICLVLGLFAGFIYAGLGVHGTLLGNSDSWPTAEMSSRGIARSLAVGILIAIPSGAGVALSILGGNAGSLVGVAISASLLPPAVNAGMLWALSIAAAISPPGLEIHVSNSSDSQANVENTSNLLVCQAFKDNAYIPSYSCNMASEAAILGTISLILTILNIASIFAVGLFVLKIKEVAPRTSPSSSEEKFFRNDLKVARASYQTVKRTQSGTLAKQFLEEYKKTLLPIEEGDEDKETKQSKRMLYFRKILQDVENDTHVKKVLGSLPSTKSPVTPFTDLLHMDFSKADRVIFEKDQEHFRNLMMAPVDADSHAKVYRTIHACDLPTAAFSTSPTTDCPGSPIGKYPLRKQMSEMYIVSGKSRPKSVMFDSPKPKKTKQENNANPKKKRTLKLIIEDQKVEFTPEVKEKDEKRVELSTDDKDEQEVESSKGGKDKNEPFEIVTITEGETTPLLVGEPRFVVETVQEKELKGEVQNNKSAEDTKALLSEQK